MVALALLILLLLACDGLLEPLLRLATWLLTPGWIVAPLLVSLAWVLAAGNGAPRTPRQGPAQGGQGEAG